MRRYLRDPTFSRFDTIPECDRHTHTQTDTRRRHIPRLARRRAVKTGFHTRQVLSTSWNLTMSEAMWLLFSVHGIQRTDWGLPKFV